MPDGFTRPPVAGAGPGIKVPKVVPLNAADEERKEVYGTLADVRAEELGGKLAIDGPEAEATPGPVEPPIEPPTVELPPEEPPRDFAAPSEDDKKEYMRCVLGERSYAKTYDLFGGVLQASLQEREIGETEKMFSTLDAYIREQKLPIEQYDLWLERFQLATNLRILTFGKRQVELEPDLVKRLTQILTLKNATYRALMETGRTFERHIQIMAENALDPNFWVAGGER